MLTLREQIIAAFTARAATLSSLPIERAQRSIDAPSDRFISIWDGEGRVMSSNYGQETVEFPIAIECIFQHGIINPSQAANALMGEITQTMLASDKTFNGLAQQITRLSETPSYPQEGSEYTTLTVIFSIKYTTLTGDPYTLINN